jgi:hypothetical protein
MPLRVTIGERNLKDGYVELKLRSGKESERNQERRRCREVLKYVEESKSV